MKKVFTFILLLLFVSCTVIAQPISDREQAVKDAKLDVEVIDNFIIGVGTGCGFSLVTAIYFAHEFGTYRSSSGLWPFARTTTGCLFGLSTMSFLNLVMIPVPATKLLGKSPEYVHAYMQTYKNRARAIRGGGAAVACLTSGVIFMSLQDFIIPLGGHTPDR